MLICKGNIEKNVSIKLWKNILILKLGTAYSIFGISLVQRLKRSEGSTVLN